MISLDRKPRFLLGWVVGFLAVGELRMYVGRRACRGLLGGLGGRMGSPEGEDVPTGEGFSLVRCSM